MYYTRICDCSCMYVFMCMCVCMYVIFNSKLKHNIQNKINEPAGHSILPTNYYILHTMDKVNYSPKMADFSSCEKLLDLFHP